MLIGVLAILVPLAHAVDPATLPGTDPLPSWNDGKAKQSVIGFVEKVTKAGSTEFIPAPERIAVFDNDGTLWSEQPMYFRRF